jgi:hypothetical protein
LKLALPNSFFSVKINLDKTAGVTAGFFCNIGNQPMSARDFLKKFVLIVAAVLAGTALFTYFQVGQYVSGPGAELTQNEAMVPRNDAEEKDAAVGETADITESGISPAPELSADEVGKYSIENYPSSLTVTGDLKGTDANGGAITITSGGVDYRAALIPGTEISRNSEKSDLSQIHAGDIVTIMGRKKSKDGREFVADKVYANSVNPTYLPITSDAVTDYIQ